MKRPSPLAGQHDCERFDCGAVPLDEWLRKRARANQLSGASRTFVAVDDARVVAYYALAAGSVDVRAATGRMRRNMPEPIPVAVLGRLAIDRSWQGQGLGRALFRDAALRVRQAAEAIGVRGILVHAVSEEARAFYLALGLESSSLAPMTLMATLGDIDAALSR